MRGRPTLTAAFAATLVGFALGLAALLALFYAGSRRTVLLASERLMSEASHRVSDAIGDHLAEAERLIGAVEAQVARGLLVVDDPAAVARALEVELAAHPAIGAVSLTHARVAGHQRGGERDGEALVGAEGRWQARAVRHGEAIDVTMTAASAGRDPTRHATFTTPVRREFRGRALWSDLSFAEDDHRDRVVTVQKALWAATGDGVGVLRVTLPSGWIDELVRAPLPGHLVFLADRDGRLVSRLAPEDRFEERDDDVRVVPAAPPSALAAALRSPLFATLAPGASAVTSLRTTGVPHLLDVTALPEGRTVGWSIGILVPESFYLGDLQASLRRWLLAAGLLVLGCVAIGALVLRATRRDLGALLGETARLQRFDFAPATRTDATFRDVQAASDGLEQAKTALRALGKYAPLDLVRQLYEARQEPALGARLQDLSILFSDVEGFTTIAESLPPAVLAEALGRYLEAMTVAIQGSRGIIDKYSGDGVMALWNAPTLCDGHPAYACAAALACREATDRLFRSDAWRAMGLGPWRTRFGLHRAEVSVGHFGAPDRMSFTAMGDGVNLAARLEGLNKQYGTQILVTAAMVREAGDAFLFRRLDRVAVKGKAEGVEVYELLGRRGAGERPAAIARYEAALAAYFDLRFAEALALLTPGEDAPADVLRARCARYLAAPPAPGWNGVYVATEK